MGPPAAWMAVMSAPMLALASTVPSLTAPLLSWISCTPMRSGERRLFTIWAARSAMRLDVARVEVLHVEAGDG